MHSFYHAKQLCERGLGDRNSVCLSDTLTAGTLWCDISNHLPNLLLLECEISVKYNMGYRPLIRLHSLKNVKNLAH